MTKEEWINLKTKEEIPLEIFYTYYTEMGGSLNFQDFQTFFVSLLTSPIAFSYNNKIINYETSIKRLYNYYDKKFDLCMN